MKERFISNDTINGRSLDTYIVTYGDLYVATVRCDVDTIKTELLDIIDREKILNMVPYDYDMFVACVSSCVSGAVMVKQVCGH